MAAKSHTNIHIHTSPPTDHERFVPRFFDPDADDETETGTFAQPDEQGAFEPSLLSQSLHGAAWWLRRRARVVERMSARMRRIAEWIDGMAEVTA